MTTNVQEQPPLALPTDAVETGVKAAPETLSQSRSTVVFFPAVLCGGLLYLCYFPMALTWLAWVALVPLLTLVRATAPAWRIYAAAYLAGAAFFWPVLQWLRVADERMYYTWAALAIYCSFYFPAAVALLRVFDRRTSLPLVVTLPLVWTGLEYVRAHLMTGFPWYFLSHSQQGFLTLTQVADLGGAYAVTFLIAAVNGLVFEWFTRFEKVRALLRIPPASVRPRTLSALTLTVVLLVAASLTYGAWRLGQDDFEDGPLVALIQSNLDQRVKLAAGASPGSESAKRMLAHNKALSGYACTQQRRPDLIVWPETSYPDDWYDAGEHIAATDLPSSVSAEVALTRQRAHELGTWWETNVLLGVNCKQVLEDGQQRSFNSATLIRKGGGNGGRYDKMHRVPFGEFVPLVDWFPWMNRFAPYDYDYSVLPGENFTRFDLNQWKFGVVICYEDTNPTLARQYVNPRSGEAPADFILNISNDGWFNGSSEHEQHLAICRFRAIECRRAVARSVNMGISALIDGNGRVRIPDSGYVARPVGDRLKYYAWNWEGDEATAPVGADLVEAKWPDFKKSAGVLLATIPIDRRQSLYAVWGDWLPELCWVAIGCALLWAIFRPRKQAMLA